VDVVESPEIACPRYTNSSETTWRLALMVALAANLAKTMGARTRAEKNFISIAGRLKDEGIIE